MRLLFVESLGFTDQVRRLLGEDSYAELQRKLLVNSDLGDVIPGCGGIRKLRVPDPSRKKGKRGGARVIYLHIPETNWLIFLDVYSKDEKDDLNSQEKKVLRGLAEALRREAQAAKGKKGRE
jgi:hypothetical protein